MVKHFLATGCLIIALVTAGNAQYQTTLSDKWKDYISLADYLQPFWKTDTIHDEIVQIIKVGDTANGSLLFKAAKILSVRSADLTKQFDSARDWHYDEGKIYLPAGSAIPFFEANELVFDTEKPGWCLPAKEPGKYLLFSESPYFRSKQISVTYTREKGSQWEGPVPVFANKGLPSTVEKLRKNKKLSIVFYGNSIETGACSSGFQHDAPYMPSWPELVFYNLKNHYRSAIQYANSSVAGTFSEWGYTSVSARVTTLNPDLVIIGFGMNDGSVGIAPEKYSQNIQNIIDSVRSRNARAEFILIATMLANPKAVQNNMQASYLAALNKLAGRGIVVANMTGVHEELLKHKSYQDMTGNNINHPNDYLARWYAQFISGLLIK